MAQLVHLNGPPGIGKSTLAALYVDRHAGTLNLDADTLHRLVGGWQDEKTDTWQVVWPLARAMAATHLDSGRDVVLPQYFGKLENITAFEILAREHGAGFREVVLLDERAAAKSSCSTSGRPRSSGSPTGPGTTTTPGYSTTAGSSGHSSSARCTTTCCRSYARAREWWWCPAWRVPCRRLTSSSWPPSRDQVQRDRADAFGRGLRRGLPVVGAAPDLR